MIDPNDVKEFMEASDQKPSADQQKLYEKLVDEEIKELFSAASDTEKLDAIIDSIWVLIGLAQSHGYDVMRAWQKVRDTNIAKIDKFTGKVLKNEYGKVVKPFGWVPPDLSDCVPASKE